MPLCNVIIEAALMIDYELFSLKKNDGQRSELYLMILICDVVEYFSLQS